MSRFSEKLKQLVNGYDKNIYQLSKNSGLDRTTIQRSITGERVPSVIFIEDLCKYKTIRGYDGNGLIA